MGFSFSYFKSMPRVRKENASEHGRVGINFMRSNRRNGRGRAYQTGIGARSDAALCRQNGNVDRDSDPRGPGVGTVVGGERIESADVAPPPRLTHSYRR